MGNDNYTTTILAAAAACAGDESEPLMGPYFVAECAFGAAVELHLTTVEDIRAELLSRDDLHPADVAAFQTLAKDPTWLAYAVHASTHWGHIGDNQDADTAARLAYRRAAELLQGS